MPARVAVGVSDSFDAVEAFTEAAAQARRGLDGADCDLCLVFAGAPHLGHAKWLLDAVHAGPRSRAPDRLRRRRCGRRRPRAGGGPGSGRLGRIAPGRDDRDPPPAPPSLATEATGAGRPADARQLGDALIVLADPHTFPAEVLLAGLNDERPGCRCWAGSRAPPRRARRRSFATATCVGDGAVACSIARRLGPAVRLAGRDPGRPRDDDHRRRGQRHPRARLGARDRAAARGDRCPRRPTSRRSPAAG